MEDETMPCLSGSKKINGFDEYEIKEAARTLMKAIEIRKDAKLLPLAQKAAAKIASEAEAAALEKKVANKMVQTFGKKD